MTQIVNPIEDTNNPGTWVTRGGSSIDLAQQINNDVEVVDDSWIWTPPNPVSSVYVTKFEKFTPAPPESLDPWTITIRMQKVIDDATQFDLTAQLLSFYIDEIDQGNLLYEETINDVTFVLQDYVLVLSGGVIDPALIPPNDLYMRLVVTAT